MNVTAAFPGRDVGGNIILFEESAVLNVGNRIIRANQGDTISIRMLQGTNQPKTPRHSVTLRNEVGTNLLQPRL